jgi:RecB family exonuclease
MRTITPTDLLRLPLTADDGPSPALRWHSVSSTREYEGCPRRYRFGYLDHRPQDRPVPPSWRFGTVVHAGLEAAYQHTLQAPDAGRAERVAAAMAALDPAWERCELGDDPAGRARAVWLVTRALTADVVGVGRSRVLGVEVAFRDELGEADRIVGFADLVLDRGDGTVEIVDHKVTHWRATPERLRGDFQLNVYGHLARRRWPWAHRVVATHHYPTGPTAVSAELDIVGMSAAIDRIRLAANRISVDREFRPTPSERCGQCPWQPSCPDGRTAGTTR